MTTQKTERKKLTASERLAKLREQESRVHRTIIKDALNGDPRFQGMKDAYQKTRRYVREAENLLSPEGFVKSREKLEARILALQGQVARLNDKRNVANNSISALRASLATHEAAQTQLGQELVALIDNGSLPKDDAGIKSAVENSLSSIDITSLAVVSDPFASFRVQKDESSEDDTGAEDAEADSTDLD